MISALVRRSLGKVEEADMRTLVRDARRLVVKVGSQMIDSSLRTKLTAMRIAMKEVG